MIYKIIAIFEESNKNYYCQHIYTAQLELASPPPYLRSGYFCLRTLQFLFLVPFTTNGTICTSPSCCWLIICMSSSHFHQCFCWPLKKDLQNFRTFVKKKKIKEWAYSLEGTRTVLFKYKYFGNLVSVRDLMFSQSWLLMPWQMKLINAANQQTKTNKAENTCVCWLHLDSFQLIVSPAPYWRMTYFHFMP